MKNVIIIEGKEFELPDELVNKIKEELNKPKKINYAYVESYLSSTYKQLVSLSTCTTEEQVKKLMAINKMLNVAKYLNEDWKPDWKDKMCKYKINIYNSNEISIEDNVGVITNFVYFKTKELAQQAINILGEDIIRIALSTDW
jgi:hypothetical protein